MSATYGRQKSERERERESGCEYDYFESTGCCCSVENPIKFNRIVPVFTVVYMTFAIDTIKLITLLMRRKEEEEEKSADWSVR